MAKSIDETIDSIGFGKFTVILITIVGLFYMGESSELNLISIISPQLRCLWNLSPLQTSFLSSAVFFGMFIGNIYWGYLGDVYGRKICIVVGALVAVYFGLLSTTSSYVFFLMTRLFVGIGLGSVAFINNYIGEFVVSKHRGKLVVCVEFFYAFGSIYVAITALLLMNTVGWKIFLVVATIPPTVFLLSSLWLPESLHYLKNTANYNQIVKILTRMSITNNVPMPSVEIECEPSSKRGDVKYLFSKEYRWKMIIMIIVSITGQCSYYGLVMLNTELLQMRGSCAHSIITNHTISCHKLDTADYTQNVFVVFAEFPGILIAMILVDWIGRKGYLITGYFLAGIGFLCLNICLNNLEMIILMFILRALMTGLSQVPFVITTELFPTVVRTTAFGLIAGISRMTLVTVPFLVSSLLHISMSATTSVFAGLCFLAAIFLIFLPETKNSLLKDV